MPGKPNEKATRAVAYARATGANPAVVAKRFGVSARTVQRGLATAGLAHAPGRPVQGTTGRVFTVLVTISADVDPAALARAIEEQAIPGDCLVSVIPGNWLKTPSQAWATSTAGTKIAETVRHVLKRHREGYPFRQHKTSHVNATGSSPAIKRAAKLAAAMVMDPFKRSTP